jgi:hypothetical protein
MGTRSVLGSADRAVLPAADFRGCSEIDGWAPGMAAQVTQEHVWRGTPDERITDTTA